ncbi:MAG: Rab family GTPase [Promethearchaeota archaeon]
MLKEEINLKLCILGAGSVGKTSMVSSFMDKEFPEVYIPTIGSNILKKEYNLKISGLFVKVNIWDVGGQKSFNPLNPVFFSNVDAAFLVFDLSQPKETLIDLEETYLKNLSKHSEKCITFIVGNKLDLIENDEDLKKIVNQIPFKNIPVILISAKTKKNIFELFELLVYSYFKELHRKFPNEKFTELSQEFLEVIGKTEKELKSIFLNLENVDSLTLPSKTMPQIIKKVVDVFETEEYVEKEQELIHYRLKKLEMFKDQITNSFNNNLTIIEDTILNLKRTPIGILNESIDNAVEQIKYLKDDFELKLESLLRIEGSEGSQLEKEEILDNETEKEITGDE